MRVIGTIEARMASTRTPGKTLMEIFNGVSLLGLVYKRFKLCKNLEDVYVATTVESQDDPIVKWCDLNNIKYFRGSEDDVLDRVTKTAVYGRGDAIVQMGADSAYLDFQLIDNLINIYKQGNYDYVCNDLQLTYPLGIYGHVVSVPRLIEINNKPGLSVHDREDVVRYIWEHPDIYRIHNITAPAEFAFPELRFTVDYPEDMQLAREISSHFNGFDFTTQDLIELYKKRPEMFEKTKRLVQKSAPFIKAQADG